MVDAIQPRGRLPAVAGTADENPLAALPAAYQKPAAFFFAMNAHLLRTRAVLATRLAYYLRKHRLTPGEVKEVMRALCLPDRQAGHEHAGLLLADLAREVNTALLDIPTIAKLVAREMNPAVWYTRQRVIGVFDMEDRRARVRIDLTYSDPMTELVQWVKSEGASLTQMELYLLLRTTFAGCLPAHANLKELVGKVDIKKAQEASGTVKTAHVSLSRSMIAEASGADKLPDPLVFDVPVYESPAFPVAAKIRCAFDLDPQTERFRVVPLPGEIERACHQAESFIAARIVDALRQYAPAEDGKESAVPVYYGEP